MCTERNALKYYALLMIYMFLLYVFVTARAKYSLKKIVFMSFKKYVFSLPLAGINICSPIFQILGHAFYT